MPGKISARYWYMVWYEYEYTWVACPNYSAHQQGHMSMYNTPGTWYQVLSVLVLIVQSSLPLLQRVRCEEVDVSHRRDRMREKHYKSRTWHIYYRLWWWIKMSGPSVDRYCCTGKLCQEIAYESCQVNLYGTRYVDRSVGQNRDLLSVQYHLSCRSSPAVRSCTGIFLPWNI